MCHGFTGDKWEWGRFTYYTHQFYKARYNVLAFDFSGSGESDDDSLTVGKWVDDLKCMIEFAKSRGFKKIGLFGHSLGGLTSLKNNSEDISCMVLTAPVTDKVKYKWADRWSPEQLKELEEKGYITKLRNKGVRHKFIIDKQMLTDRENLNQAELLKSVDCPVLIIHGDKDTSVPIKDSINAVKFLKYGELDIINGAGHDMEPYLEEFSKKAIKWFDKYLA